MSSSALTPKPATLRWSGWTDVGRVRKNNEDAFLALEFDAREVRRLGKAGESSTQNADFAFAVSDGMGGAMAGEYASRIAVEKITTLLPRSFELAAHGLNAGVNDVLVELFEQIHRALVYVGGSYEECAGMATTLSLGWFTPGWLYFGHVGDSRIYYLPGGGGPLRQLTEDDTHVGWLLRNGMISEHEARTHPRRNVLQKALGGDHRYVDPQIGAVGCEPGDIFLFCTDGLTAGLFDHRIIDLLRESENSAGNASLARRMVEESVRNDGRDNATALVVRVG